MDDKIVEKILEKVLTVLVMPLALIIVFPILAIFALVAKYLWNAILPSLFGFPVIGFWQILGLMLLIKILK